MKKGKFIVFEGGEGSGKSTMAKEMAEAFQATYTREPGGTPLAEKIREEVLLGEFQDIITVKTQFAFMWGARADHVEHLIEPTLAAGRNVFCDRFDGSTFVYQARAKGGEDLHKLFFATREAYLRSVVPDLYLVFDVPVETGLARVSARPEAVTVFDKKDKAFHERIRESYLEFAKLPEIPAQIIDASKPIEAVRETVAEHIRKVLES